MHFPTILRVLGILLILFSLTMFPPAFVDMLYHEGMAYPFIASFAVIAGTGCLLWLPHRKSLVDLKIRDGFFIAVLFWTVLSFASALPFIIAENPNLSLTDAVFEAISGITTTGSTVIANLDALPHSILYYRQQLQLLGGLGILILAVAILPMLGVGGMQLFRSESTGPVKDSKLTPRIAETAKALWMIYLLLTIACILSYFIAGMGLFDAICYGFSTVATGGFAPHNASLAYYHEPIIQLIAIAFMLLSAISFPLHYAVLRRRRGRIYFQDEELTTFFAILAGSCLLTFSVMAWMDAGSHNYFETLFHIVSFATTTGLTAGEYHTLPLFLPMLLLFLGVIGGCAESTTGGIKVIRFTLLRKQGAREIKRLIHPNAEFVVHFGHAPVKIRIIEAIWGFLAIYVSVFIVLLLMVQITEPDFTTAYSILIASLSNIGPALGNAIGHFGDLHPQTKWVLSFAMLAGRLEILPILVCLSPAFWRD